jgi:hypothetical protein
MFRRPKRVFRRDEVVRLRDSGMSWRAIAATLGIPVMSAVDAYRATPDRTEIVSAGTDRQDGKRDTSSNPIPAYEDLRLPYAGKVRM